jgi:diguanylate cyclase (GGDEF)-like protein
VVKGARRLALPVLALGWLLLSLYDGFSPADLVAGLLAAAIGLLLPVLWPRGADWIEAGIEAFQELVGETGTAAQEGWSGEAIEDPGDVVARVPAPEEIDAPAILQTLAEELEADRVVIWELEPDGAVLTPVIGTGTLPASTPVTGSPLAWAASEGRALRLDPPPLWALGACTVAPIDDRAVLTAETTRETAVDPDRLARTAAFAAVVRSVEVREHAVRAQERRLDRAVELLRTVPRETDSARIPGALALAALELARGRGALVAAWHEDRGVVLASAGEGGGPRPGTQFGAVDGDLGHAARTGAAFPREPGDRTTRPLATKSEDWERGAAAYRTVLPLLDPDGRVGGLVAAWGDQPLATQGIALLEALGPLVAVQLRQATDLARFRARATLDALTGLPNRGSLEEHMTEETARFHRYRRPVAVIVLDLDHFKSVNDRHGHDAGDAVLRAVGRVLMASVREADFAARYGGEELVVVLHETMLRPAVEAAERIRHAIESARIEHGGVVIPVTASLGVSACPECVDDPGELFTSADAALYASKEGGRNRVTAAGMRTA